jgi:hypothetical protein
MSLEIQFGGLWDCKTETHVESTLRECVGDVPGNEKWKVSITSYGSYCVVLVKTPRQTCRKVFALMALASNDAIPAWLNEYPLK